MGDWEDEPVQDLFKLKEPLKGNWDDEDLDDVKESWEDDDDSATVPNTEAPPPKKAPKKAAAKSAEKKVEAIETAEDAPLDHVQEKLRQQRLVEEADYKSTAELFAKKGGDDKTLDNFIPKTESDFAEHAELISNKLRPYEKSFHYIGLLKAVMRLSLTSLKGSDAKEVASSITAIANEKIKAEKDASTSKKRQVVGKKKQLHIGKPDDDVVPETYDDFDDYDFM